MKAVHRRTNDFIKRLGLNLLTQADPTVTHDCGHDESGKHLMADILRQKQAELLLLVQQGSFGVLGNEDRQQQTEAKNNGKQAPGNDSDELERPAAAVVILYQ